MPTPRPLRAALALTACLLSIAAILASAAPAETSHARKSSCAATKSAHRKGGSRCVKPAHRKSSRKHTGKRHGKKTADTIFLTPATCEDGSRPTRGEDGSYSCEDGSQPVCEDGSSPILLSSASTPMCRLRPGQKAGGSECEGESEECMALKSSCEDESGQPVDCEQLSESPSGEEAEEEES